MTRILVVGEDDLTCALGERILSTLLPKWTAAAPTINTRGITKLAAALPRYQQFAQSVAHVLCIADSDGRCPEQVLLELLPHGRPNRLMIRLAVNEAESWALGDRHSVAEYFRVPINVIPHDPDSLDDPKREMLSIVKRSATRRFRDEMLGGGREVRPGVGYNVHLRRFVSTRWNAIEAEGNSRSLHRAMNRIRSLA